jgi:hypothetical protein
MKLYRKIIEAVKMHGNFAKNSPNPCQPLNEKNLKILSIAALPKGHIPTRKGSGCC